MLTTVSPKRKAVCITNAFKAGDLWSILYRIIIKRFTASRGDVGIAAVWDGKLILTKPRTPYIKGFRGHSERGFRSPSRLTETVRTSDWMHGSGVRF